MLELSYRFQNYQIFKTSLNFKNVKNSILDLESSINFQLKDKIGLWTIISCKKECYNF